jgi:hypothetical protein
MVKFLLIALCIYLTIKWVIAPFLRIILQNYLKGMVEKHGGSQQHKTTPRKADGSIHIDYIPETPKSDKKKGSEGEYIDYEEIK